LIVLLVENEAVVSHKQLRREEKRRETEQMSVSKDDRSTSTSSSPAGSSHSSSSDLKAMAPDTVGTAPIKRKSLKERSRIPPSIYITGVTVLLLQYCSGLWKIETFQRWYNSMKTSAETTVEFMGFSRDLMQAAVKGEVSQPAELLKAAVVCALTLSLGYVFVWAPFRAGMWTGTKARKQMFHRYMGLLYLVMYFFAWVEFGTNYENGAQNSILPHFIAINGEWRARTCCC
jgi:hypothetical protein